MKPEKLKPTAVDNAESTKIRAGIVGAGLMGRWHAHALEREGGEVVGIADYDLTKAEALAGKYPNTRKFGDVEKMLADRQIDVLHICSPIESHIEIAERAINSGVHLLVEKPLAETNAATLKLYEMAREKKKLLCPVHQFAFQRGVEKAKSQLRRIGQLIHVEAKICSAGGTGLDAEHLDAIAIDILPHPLSLLQRFLETDITAVEWDVFRPIPGELRISGRDEDSISISIFISMNSRPTENTFHLLGTHGGIHLDLFHGYSFMEPGNVSKMAKLTHPFDYAARSFGTAAANLALRSLRREVAYPGLRRLIGEFYRSVKFGLESPISRAEALAIAEVRDLVIARAGIAERTR